MIIKDIKSNTTVLDSKPRILTVKNTKPFTTKVSGETEVYYDATTLLSGQPMGLLLTLTYPETTISMTPRT